MGRTKDSSPNSSPLKLPAAAPRSPAKTKKSVPLPKSKTPLTVYCLTFSECFTFEIYFYEKNQHEDGFSYGLAQYVRGNEENTHHDFEACNFTQVLNRRVAGSNDVEMLNQSNSYNRKIFLRYPREGKSSEETRKTGLAAVKGFLMDKRFTKYPPNAIETIDMTNFESTNPSSMDDFMMNVDIEAALREDLDPDVLTDSFKVTYPHVAEVLWKSICVGNFGKSLGF